jgi:hypothetical protein
MCDELTGYEQTLEVSFGNSGAETTDGTLIGTDRHWTDFRREQWTQWHTNNRVYPVR